MHGISALVKETPRELSCPLLLPEDTERGWPSAAGSRLSPHPESVRTLILEPLASRTVRNIFLLFISHPVYDILLEEHGQSKIIVEIMLVIAWSRGVWGNFCKVT